jgi:hypothetical protein
LRPTSGAGFRAFFEGAALSRGAVAVEDRFMPDRLPVVDRMQHRPAWRNIPLQGWSIFRIKWRSVFRPKM